MIRLFGFFDIDLQEVFVYFGDEFLVSCFMCEYILPFYGVSFSTAKEKDINKLFRLIRSQLFIFVFVVITLGGGSKKILLQFMSERV